jgi:hypothetical protein
MGARFGPAKTKKAAKAPLARDHTSYSTACLEQNGGQVAIFFYSRGFAAERLISGPVLAIYTASGSSYPRSKGHF